MIDQMQKIFTKSPITQIIVTDVAAMEKELMPNGELLVVPAEIYLKKYYAELPYFAYKHAFYTLPTTELIEFLKKEIGDRTAIEIGSGNGIIGKVLGIPCTDSKLQRNPMVQIFYTASTQPTIKYPEWIIRMDALAAAKHYKPDVIVGSWITGKYNPKKGIGNQWGPREDKLLKHCKKYIHIGNKFVHDWKDILELPHKEIKLDGYVSRSSRPEGNVIYIWGE
jgi:hypothetical protein